MPRLELPHDNWAELREADEVPRRLAQQYRKVLYRLSTGATVDQSLSAADQAEAAGRSVLATESGLLGLEEMTEALVFAIVKDWSYGDVDQATLDGVPDAAVEAIHQEAVAGDYIAKLNPNFGVSPEPDSPTTP